MTIRITDGEIKGAKTRKSHQTSFVQNAVFDLNWEVKNTTSSKNFRKKRIWFRIQQRVARPNPVVSASSFKWQDLVAKTELCAGQSASGVLENSPTTPALSTVNGVRQRLPDFRIVVTRKSGAAKREYESYLGLTAN